MATFVQHDINQSFLEFQTIWSKYILQCYAESFYRSHRLAEPMNCAKHVHRESRARQTNNRAAHELPTLVRTARSDLELDVIKSNFNYEQECVDS